MMVFQDFEFANPGFLWGLISLPLIFWWYWYSAQKRNATLKVAATDAFVTKSLKARLYPFLNVLKVLAVLFLWLALARPRTVSVTKQTKSNKGIDIVMAIDVSSSMLARDLRPSRLEALKRVAVDFVRKRPNDRIGIVVYAGESFTKTPVTSDKDIIVQSILSINYGQIEDGTAIGMGLGAAVNRLKNSRAKSKIVILLTDGVNNTGFIDPNTATELAKDLGIKVYTIAIGTNGMAPFPYAKDSNGKLLFRKQRVEIDEKLLREIADQTGGLYFRATDNKKLQEIYNEIDQLETSKIEEFKYYNYREYFRFCIALAIFLMGLFLSLRYTLFNGFI